MSAARARSAEAGCCRVRVKLVERRGYLGGRASSYRHPGVDEVIDNCQHVLFGCCTNLIGFYRRIGVAERIHWTSAMTMIEPGGRRSAARAVLVVAGAAAWVTEPDRRQSAYTRRQDALGARVSRPHASGAARIRQRRLARGSSATADKGSHRSLLAAGDCERAERRCRSIALPYAAKVIRELFLNSAEAGSMGMSTVPLSELYCGAEQFLREHGGESCSMRAWTAHRGTRRRRSGR
jgi:hypothetical protein